MEKDTTLLWTRRYPLKPTVFRNPHRAWSDPHESRWQVRYRYESPQSFPTWEEAYGYAYIAATAMEEVAEAHGYPNLYKLFKKLGVEDDPR